MVKEKVATPEVAQEVAQEAAEKQVFILDDGREASRSAFIRQEFKKDKSRGDIAKELNIPYSLVYTATANMYNVKHPESGDVVRARGTMLEDGTPRSEYFRKQVAAGVSRGELAKEFDIPYATVYAATKEIKTGAEGERHGRVTLTEGPGAGMARAAYIRQEVLKGRTRRDIANELACDYAVVWAAARKVATPGQEEAGEDMEALNAQADAIEASEMGEDTAYEEAADNE